MSVRRVGGDTLTGMWGTRVRPAAPLRVLALSGPPGPEARWVLRALEESGEEVTSWAYLGRELWMGREEGPLPRDAAAYAPYDVIILFPGVDVPPQAARALLEAVEQRGLGLLLAATTGGAEALDAALGVLMEGGGWQDEIIVPAEALRWRIPPELAPLPPAPLETRLLVDGSEPPAQGSALTLGALGRGRLGALALPDTWSWRMSAGAVDGHRTFWREAVSWLADGFRGDPVLEILASDARVGDRVLVRRVDRAAPADGAEAMDLLLRTPAGPEPLETAAPATAASARTTLGAFIPRMAGGYTATVGATEGDGAAARPEADTGPSAHLQVSPAVSGALDPEGRLARLALGAPGGAVTVAGAQTPEGDTRSPAPRPWLAYLFAALALLLAAEWLHRRLGARP